VIRPSEEDEAAEDSVGLPSEEASSQETERQEEDKPKVHPVYVPEIIRLKALFQWNEKDKNTPLAFVESLLGYFYEGSSKVVITTDSGHDLDDLDLAECITVLNDRQCGQVHMFHANGDELQQEFLSISFAPSNNGDTLHWDMDISLTTEWDPLGFIDPPRSISWYQSDLEEHSPLPVLALPMSHNRLQSSALHGLAVLAKKISPFSSAELVKERAPGQRETLARWHSTPPSTESNVYPIIPIINNNLWLPIEPGEPQSVMPELWLEMVNKPEEREHENIRERLKPLFTDEAFQLERIDEKIHEAFQLTVPVEFIPLSDLDRKSSLTTIQDDTVLALSPMPGKVVIGIDTSSQPVLLKEAILHGIGHVLLGHVRPGDPMGHTDSAESVLGQGTLRRWDREVRDTFSSWFLPEVQRKVETLADCTVREKALLGLWRMIGEMLGESRRLHPRAEKYQRAAYQRQGAQRLLAQLEEYGGAMLCDGVGLGKTYVATTLMVHYANAWRDRHKDNPDDLLADPFRITILAPNSVVSTWQREALPQLASFGVSLASVRVISHTKLSRITKASEVLEPGPDTTTSDMEHLLLSDLVIVDEAHNFRSVNARRTVVLRDLLRLQPRKEQRRKVLLLTATPVNNTLDDLMQESALLFSKPLWLSDAVTDDGYRRQAVKDSQERCARSRKIRTTGKDVTPFLIHGDIDAKFSLANDFRDDLDFGPNVQRIGEYLKEQNQKLQRLQQEIRDAAEAGVQRTNTEPTRIAEELLDRIVVQRSRNLCKEIERQQGSDMEILFRKDADLPEKLHYHDEYDGIHDVLAGFLPLFERGEENSLVGPRPLSLKVYMWYDVREGIKAPDDLSPVVGLQRILVLKRLESSPVSFLITLLRLMVLHAYRLQQLISLCEKAKSRSRAAAFSKEISHLLSSYDDASLDKVCSLATGVHVKNLREEFIKHLSKAYVAKVPAAEADDAPIQLQLFDDDASEESEMQQQFDRLWGLKDYLLQDFDTLLRVTPNLADVIFGKFDRTEWPHNFTLGGEEVDWPRSAAWGLRIVTDAKIRSLFVRLIKARRSGQKVIVFSQFSDTLAYVNSVLQATGSFTQPDWRMVLPALAIPNLKADEVKSLVNIAGVITGDTEDRDEVVNSFAPFYRIGPFPPSTEGMDPFEQMKIRGSWESAWSKALHNPIHVLFSSDILAEGVNLQDAAALINFDIHWNPVRMIQRAGRIDRRLNPKIEKARSFSELEDLARKASTKVPLYYWHGHEKDSPLTVNMILPEELEAELLLRERIALKTLAIDFTLGLDQGTGAEADWMQNYTYQGVSSLNAFQKDRAIEQVAGYHEKISRIFKNRGIVPEWASDLNIWVRAKDATVGSPLVGRALLGRRDGALEKFSRYLEPTIHEGVPYWFWAEKKPGESVFDGWLIMDGRQENFPPHPRQDIPWHERVSLPLKASHLLGAAMMLDKEVEVQDLPRQEIGRPLMQGATALAAPKLGSDEDRLLIALRDFFILQLKDFDPEMHGGSVS